ncbi:hypothetical protein [Streptomyces sp. WELS2]|uniref:hypothetical protein n=1 Tax=Streptomyces sp. WELS2 TaxID=2749435 RepID=UPI0015F0AB1C|nr:hypothetical protein [Streptomyces sp. WELS2]
MPKKQSTTGGPTARRAVGVALAAGFLTLAVAAPQPALALTAGPATTTARTATAATVPSPVGTWSVTTQESDHPASTGTLYFYADHTLRLEAHPGPDGKPVFIGTGEWCAGYGGTLHYEFTHPLPGTRTGTAYVELDGVLTSSTAFSAHGLTNRVYDDGGTETVTIDMTGTRTA